MEARNQSEQGGYIVGRGLAPAAKAKNYYFVCRARFFGRYAPSRMTRGDKVQHRGRVFTLPFQKNYSFFFSLILITIFSTNGYRTNAIRIYTKVFPI